MLRWVLLSACGVMHCVTGVTGSATAQDPQEEQREQAETTRPTGQEAKRLQKIQEYLNEAGQLYLKKEYPAAGKPALS